MSPIERIQQDLADKLGAEPYFADIPIFALKALTEEDAIDQALAGVTTKAGKRGAAVSVLMPTVDCEKPNSAGPECKGMIRLRSQALPQVNDATSADGTGKSAQEIALAVAQTLHHFHLIGMIGPLYPAKEFLTPSLEFPPRLTYFIDFLFLFPLEKAAKVSTPFIAPSSGAATQIITITCPTATAAIYYTTDGSLPTPTNGTQYTVPFEANTSIIRAAAYAPALIGSDPMRAEYDITVLGADAQTILTAGGTAIVID